MNIEEKAELWDVPDSVLAEYARNREKRVKCLKMRAKVELDLFQELVKKCGHVGSLQLDKDIRKFIRENTDRYFWQTGLPMTFKCYGNCRKCYRIGPRGHTCAHCFHKNPKEKRNIYFCNYYWRLNRGTHIVISPLHVEKTMLLSFTELQLFGTPVHRYIVFKKLDYQSETIRGRACNRIERNRFSDLESYIPNQLFAEELNRDNCEKLQVRHRELRGIDPLADQRVPTYLTALSHEQQEKEKDGSGKRKCETEAKLHNKRYSHSLGGQSLLNEDIRKLILPLLLDIKVDPDPNNKARRTLTSTMSHDPNDDLHHGNKMNVIDSPKAITLMKHNEDDPSYYLNREHVPARLFLPDDFDEVG